jgi:DNA-binding transcriptional regulator YdaS (Cro superfamily)
MRGSTRDVLAVCETQLGSWASTLEAVTPDALRGDLLAIRSYATAYHDLVRFVHLAFDPDLRYPEGSLVALREATVAPLRSRAPQDTGIGIGIVCWVVASVRDVLPDEKPLVFPKSWPHALGAEVDRAKLDLFDRLVDALVDRQLAGDPLDEIQAVFDLNATDLAGLFGVERQAVSQWRARGIPSARRAKVTTVAEIATILRHRLRPANIPGVVRKSADAYGHRNMLEMIADDEQDELLAVTKRSFDWATTA